MNRPENRNIGDKFILTSATDFLDSIGMREGEEVILCYDDGTSSPAFCLEKHLNLRSEVDCDLRPGSPNLWHFIDFSRLEPQNKDNRKQRKGIMSSLIALTKTIKNYFSKPIQAQYRLGWVRMDGDDLTLTEDGKNELLNFLALEDSTIAESFGKFATNRVKEIQDEEKKK